MAAGYGLLQIDDQLPKTAAKRRNTGGRLASLDVFRGLCILLMMLVDYGGSIFPIIAHSPWNGLHLADFVMPFFLFIAGVSLALVYKKVTKRIDATWKAMLRAVKLFFLGVFLQGGYFHGINSLTYGVDIERIRWFGILQRISIGYIVAALCEIWLSRRTQSQREIGFFKNYYWHWVVAFSLSAVYLGLLYGLYVPDWQFEMSNAASSALPINGSNVYMVKCSVRGDLGPACNSAGMIDRYVLGFDHLYTKPVHRNLKECNMTNGQVSESSPSWCHAPFDPEGLLSSLTAAITCIIGLQCGHVLAHIQEHKGRIESWSLFSASLLLLGSVLAFIGIPVNKSLYTISYMLITSALSGITFCALYLLVDVYGYRRVTFPLEWMGKHSLSIFILVTSNILIIAIQGFYWKNPEKNLIHLIVTCFVHR
ncbi:heparan-alpha-glucosaminide N-acetyltransferase isoform X2 [Ricinus communis]|uniref:heparan-alpha-glucosaminide N-acetyltransferase isoform X2 n=1 Tax=Ricinus communis TaxID=3988 RepID=UPI00077284C2|nr:heparan-alpha-glucosaminide N-acetyltransferase isoform X2 [Ricinus communis]|eukprot:XP_015582430.1 heparan-alpha-glucosaminide N-acetyltransferase [Ricinus communis]